MTGNGPVAIIDIGSNSVRLVVYERLARSPTPFFNEKVLAGLGRSVAESGRLDEDAVHRTEDALKRFRALCDQMGVRHLDVLATAAVREAENGQGFLGMAEEICRRRRARFYPEKDCFSCRILDRTPKGIRFLYRDRTAGTED